MEPLSILRDAIKAVPAVKYALGIAGIVSAIAIVAALGLDLRVAGFGTIIMIFLMALLLLFAKLTGVAKGHFLVPALVLAWSSLTLTVGTACLLFSSVFFTWPVSLRHWLISGDVVYESPGDAEVDVQVLSGQSWKLPPDRIYRSINFEVRMVNNSALPVPVDPSALLVVSGDDGEFRIEMSLEVSSGESNRGAILEPKKPQSVFLEGWLSKNNEEHLGKGYTAYLQLFYDKALTDESVWFISEFFDFDTKRIEMHGD